MSDAEDSSSDDDARREDRDDNIVGVLDDCIKMLWDEAEATQYFRVNPDSLTKGAIAALMRAQDDLENLSGHPLPLAVFEKMVELRARRKHCGDTYDERHDEGRLVYAEARREDKRACDAGRCGGMVEK